MAARPKSSPFDHPLLRDISQPSNRSPAPLQHARLALRNENRPQQQQQQLLQRGPRKGKVSEAGFHRHRGGLDEKATTREHG